MAAATAQDIVVLAGKGHEPYQEIAGVRHPFSDLDQADRAAVLARQLRRRGDWNWAHVNLIPLNPTPGSRWTASRQEDQDAFVATLERWKIPVTVRDTRGSDIDGACGQLAAKGRVDELGV